MIYYVFKIGGCVIYLMVFHHVETINAWRCMMGSEHLLLCVAIYDLETIRLLLWVTSISWVVENPAINIPHILCNGEHIHLKRLYTHFLFAFPLFLFHYT